MGRLTQSSVQEDKYIALASVTLLMPSEPDAVVWWCTG